MNNRGAPHDTLSAESVADTLMQPAARPVSAAAPVSPDAALDPNDIVPALPDPGEIAARERYALLGVLGEGGMGVVQLCEDRLVGRRVAMKVARLEPGDEPSRHRFLREARVQGQLEHPAVVPVYDLGVGPDGVPFFTMKRVRGQSLDALLDLLRTGDAEAQKRYSRRRLLTAFASVCLAVDFAHARGVVHRDIKPANIMLGDFGEVYVLDWGIARVGAEVEASRPNAAAPEEIVQAPVPGSARTRAGDAMGTLGYMPLEQLKGDMRRVGPRSDVYALGAVLFEILTLERLHAAEDGGGLIGSTITGADARASARAPEREVPPELEALCVAATAMEPEDRLPSARALHEGVERFLDGEQNATLRQEMAASHARTAAGLLSDARGGELSDERRRKALSEVGRALALDPDQADALGTLREIFGAAPRELPPEVARDIESEFEARRRAAGRTAFVAYASMAGYLPALLWLGVREWGTLAVFYAFMTLAAAASLRAWRGRSPGWGNTMLALLASNIGFAISCRMFGPLVLAPTMVAVNTTAFALHLPGWRRWAAMACGAAATLVPVALEALGVVERSYVFGPDGMRVVPHMLAMPALPTTTLLALTGASAVFTGSLGAGDIHDALTSAERRMHLQRWQLEHLVPGAEKRATRA